MESFGNVSCEVGDEATWERKVLKEHVSSYAEITGDTNPLHFDAAYAEASRFGGLITHGGIQSGALNALVAMKLPGAGSVFLKQELDYTKCAPARTTAPPCHHATAPLCCCATMLLRHHVAASPCCCVTWS